MLTTKFAVHHEGKQSSHEKFTERAQCTIPRSLLQRTVCTCARRLIHMVYNGGTDHTWVLVPGFKSTCVDYCGTVQLCLVIPMCDNFGKGFEPR